MLPPLVLHDSRPGIFVLLMPYHENQALFDKIMENGQERALQDLATWDATTNSFPATPDARTRYRNWWDNLSEAEQNEYSSISLWKCPTRRSGIQMATDIDTSIYPIGPVSDYAAVCLVANTTVPNGWYSNFRSNDINHINPQLGPFRPARLPGGGNVDKCIPRDPISYWGDGTSNQIIIGEKHVPQGLLNVCRTPWYAQGECTVLTSNDRAASGMSRQVNPSIRLAQGPNDFVPPDFETTDNQDGYTPIGDYGFGSYHSGICQFLLGDGAVRAFPNSTPMAEVLCRLANVADGESVSIP
jgi:hypothetical protein